MTIRSASLIFLFVLNASPALALNPEDPVIPSIKIDPAADANAANEKVRSQNDALFLEMSKANADLTALHAKVVQYTVELRQYNLALAANNPDPEAKKAAQAAIEKITPELKPLTDRYMKATAEMTKLCMKQFEQPAFHAVSDSEKSAIERAGFACIQGERMVADTTPRELINCGMQVAKVSGGLGYVPGGGAGGAVSGAPGMVPGGHGHQGAPGGGGFHGFTGCSGPQIPSQPLGLAACLNGQGKVTASAAVRVTTYNGKKFYWTGNNTRFHFDDQNRVKGWTAGGPELSVETELKGDSIVKRTMHKDKEVARCEWKIDVDLEKFFSEGGKIEPRVKPSDMVK